MTTKRKKAVRRRSTKSKGSSGIPAWFWLLGGVLIGLGTAVVLMVKGYLPEIKQHMPATDSSSPASSESALIEKRDKEAEKAKKPRYDFFTVLPEMEVVVPEQETTAGLQQTAQPPIAAPVVTAEPVRATRPQQQAAPVVTTTAKPQAATYYLQVGSFKNGAQAERFKAELALQGMQTSIQTVTINNKDTYHRVRVGPFRDLNALDKTRQTLKKKGIDSTPIKVTG